MVRSIPGDYFVKWSSSEVTDIGSTSSKWTRGLCHHHNYIYLYYYDALEDTITHKNSLKLKSYPGENVTDCCDEILVYAECLESAGDFKPEQLGYITHIFEDNSDLRLRSYEI